MSDVSLLRAIEQLTRADLAETTFCFQPPASHFIDKAGVRLTRLSRFWETAGAPSIREASEDFVAGLFGHDCQFLFAIVGCGTELSCWFGGDQNSLDQPALGALVRSAFPDSRCSEEPLTASIIAGLKYGFVVAGCPDTGDWAKTNGRERLEKLARNLIGSNWLYVVSATPLGSDEIAERAAAATRRIEETRVAHLLRQSSLGDAEHAAVKYVKMLERSLERLDEAAASGMWHVRCCFYTDDSTVLPRARHALQSAFAGPGSHPSPIRVRPCVMLAKSEPELEPLTSRELALLTRPLLEDAPGYEVVDYTRFGLEGAFNGPEPAIDLGNIRDRGHSTGRRFRLARDSLTQHALIVGITGAGKTNTCFNLLDQVWDGGEGVPFLAIESAKFEYRVLLTSGRFPGLRVFTVGDETIAPLRINPFEVPLGIAVQTHADYIRCLFSAAFVLYPPMPYVLERAIQSIYEDRGWDMAHNINKRGTGSVLAFPTLDDLANKVEDVVEAMGYDQRITMDVRAGLRARIDQLRYGGGKGRLLNTRDSVDSRVLFDSPCLLELKNIIDDDEKAFIIGLILVRLYEHREANWDGSSGLKHITLIEEAHRLLRNVATGPGNDISANPKGRAIEVFANILSEIRAFGEGIVVAEQIPTKLASDVIKNTATKILHRLVSEDDRALVAGATDLNEGQTRHLARLGLGEAVVWANGAEKAAVVSVPRFDGVTRDMISAEKLRTLMSPADPFCQACGKSHSAFRGKPLDNPALSSIFHRVYNALRFAPSQAGFLTDDFVAAVKREGLTDGWEIYCVFSQLAHSALDARGAAGFWTHEAVENMSAAVCAAISSVLEGVPNISPLQEPTDGNAPPFAGCVMCDAHCMYRYDAVSFSGAGKFRAALSDSSCPTTRLAQLALDTAADRYSPRDPRSLRGAALCFAIQQGAATAAKLSDHHQIIMARLMKEALVAQQ